MKAVLAGILLTLTALALFALAIVYSGAISVAADAPHWRPVQVLLDNARRQSVTAHSRAITVPDLSDPTLLLNGAGNYAAMCAGCHLAPGVASTELHRGLSPTPPNLTEQGVRQPAEAFWIIKHGIQSTGMPAWGESMAEGYIWGLVAFLQTLPSLDRQQYQALIAASGGHRHGGGESGEPHSASQKPAIPGRSEATTGSTGERPGHLENRPHEH